MAYKALYRTYRPTTFDEVVGQQHIVKTIKNALVTGKIAHAYLFAGPRGTGKTTMARLLAKALNCEEGIGHQCNECKNCKAINEGNHPDVIEIDAASNNGVDEIRELTEKVKYATLEGRYKIYIIDEVHVMTTQAFNALLKTLEEPPEHVIFILATTEPHKILPTILSRCQRYDFSKVGDEDIKHRLAEVLEAENVQYNEDAINLIISLCDGGMRDALSILEQVLAYSGDTLNVEDILDIFALESREEKINLLSAISKGDTDEVLSRVTGYFKKGSDIKRLTDDLLVILKDTLIYQNTRNDKYLESLSIEDVQKMSSMFDKKAVVAMIDALMETSKSYKTASSINPIFEIAVLKLCSLHSNEEVPQRMEAAAPKMVVEPVAPKPAEPKVEIASISTPTPAPTIAPTPIQPSFSNVTMDENPIILVGSEKEDGYSIDDGLMVKIFVKSVRETKYSLIDSWKKLDRLAMHPSLGKAATLLIDSFPLVASNKILIVETPLQTTVETINSKGNQIALQKVVKNVFGIKAFVYAVTRADSVRLQKIFTDSRALNNLPKRNTFELEFKGE